MGNKVSIRMPGPHARMDAEAVVQTLGRLLRTATELEVAQVGGSERTPRSRWTFTELGLGSVHATLALLEARGPATPEVLDRVALKLVTGFADVETTSAIPDGWSPDAANRAKSVADGLRGDLAEGLHLTLVTDSEAAPGPTARVSRQASAHLKEALSVRQESIGSVSGVIGSVNVHRRNVAGLWPERGGARLEVIFEDQDLDGIRDALGHRVLVAGRLKRNGVGQVVRLAMRSIERLPEQAEPLHRLYRMDPTLTGDLSTLEYLRIIRGAS